MDEIQITDLSSRVLNAMRARNLKAKPITEFERYGLRRILLHFSEHEWIAYSKEAVWAFVLQERLRVESGQLPAYQWAHARRAAVYLEQMAEHGVIQESPLPRWEAEHNRLFRSVAQDEPPSQKIEILICQVRDAIMKLDMSEKAKRNYLYCGLGAVLKHFDFQGEMIYSEELLDTFLADSQEQYLSGEIKQATWQSIRKSVLWIKEYRETEHITHRKLTNTAFIYASPDFERLIQEYAAYMRNADYLKEKTQSVYIAAVRAFFKRMESLGPIEYNQLTLCDVTACISKTATEMPLGIFNTMVALRSFAQFVSDIHPELPNITAALNCTPAKRRRVYVGYSDEDAQKILAVIDRESIKGKRDFAMVMLAYSTGLRSCDILNLKFENIDWRTHEIRLIQEKTNVPLALPLDAATGNAIAEYILNGRPECDSEYVFIRTQHPYTRMLSFWQIVAEYARRALGTSRKMNGPHAFRRGMGRRLLEAGVPSPMICDVLGHTSAAPLRQYTASSLECLRKCARTLESIPVMQEELQ